MKSANSVPTELVHKWAGKIRHWLLGAFWVLLVFFLIWTSFFTVPADSVAIVQRFGRYLDTDDSGLHFKIPFGVDKVTLIPVRRQLKLEFGFGDKNATNPYQASREPQQEQDMVTGDLNSANVEWVVQYMIEDPKAYLFATSDPEETLRAASEAVMREVIGDRTIDEVITYGRQDIENSATPLTQALCKKYELGLRVTLIQLKNVNPPQPVQDSFNDVNNAQQEKQRAINNATGQYNQVIPKARGEADQTAAEANGYASKRINEATGDANYFSSIFAEYSKAPDITRKRLCLETVTTVMPKISHKIILDDDTAKLLPFLLSSPGTRLGQ
jgi:membrane protease subunit HflK